MGLNYFANQSIMLDYFDFDFPVQAQENLYLECCYWLPTDYFDYSYCQILKVGFIDHFDLFKLVVVNYFIEFLFKLKDFIGLVQFRYSLITLNYYCLSKHSIDSIGAVYF